MLLPPQLKAKSLSTIQPFYQWTKPSVNIYLYIYIYIQTQTQTHTHIYLYVNTSPYSSKIGPTFLPFSFPQLVPLQVSYRQQNLIHYNYLPLPPPPQPLPPHSPQPLPRSPSCKHTQAYSFHSWHTHIITMYTPLEYILTIISLLNLCTAGVIYIIDRKQGEATINSGKYFKSFKICMTMSIMFGIASMCMMITNLKRWKRATTCNRYE